MQTGDEKLSGMLKARKPYHPYFEGLPDISIDPLFDPQDMQISVCDTSK